MNSLSFMKQALDLLASTKDYKNPIGEIPVAALLVNNDTILCSAINSVNCTPDPTAHAEILVLRRAAHILQSSHLVNCDLYVTLEPCAMCAHATSLARIRRLYFGAYNVKSGGVDNGARVFDFSHHVPEIYGGIMEDKCAEVLQSFFRLLR